MDMKMSMLEHIAKKCMNEDKQVRVCSKCESLISNCGDKPIRLPQPMLDIIYKKYKKTHGYCVKCYEKELRGLV